MDYNPYSRYPVCVDAVIFALDLHAPIECVIRNVSEGGALLSLPKPVRLPKLIYLSLGKGAKVVECEVRWRNSNRLMGVRFTPNTSLEARQALLESCAFAEGQATGTGGR